MLKKIIVATLGLILLVAVMTRVILFFPTLVIKIASKELSLAGCNSTLNIAVVDSRYVFIESQAHSCFDADTTYMYDRSTKPVCHQNAAWMNKPLCDNERQEQMFSQLYQHAHEPNFGLDSSHTVQYYMDASK